jgi:sulfofructose kinase
MPIDVLCIGHAAYDMSFFVDGYPRENSKHQTEDLLEDCGGPASNAAYLLSKWKVGCAFAGLVGDDLYGHRIADSLRSVGTDISMLEIRAGHVTPLSVIVVNNQNGTRTIVNRNRRSAMFGVERFAWDGIEPSVLLFDGHAMEASLAALEMFPNATSILDAGSWREGTAALAGKVDHLAASERFTLQATDLPDLRSDRHRRQCLKMLREMFTTNVIVTLGEEGLIADDGEEFLHLPAFPAIAVDSTAAGDIFHGAFAYGVSASHKFQESLRFASMAAALSVTERGGRASIPTLDQVTDALKSA